jgi:hypothetical protein
MTALSCSELVVVCRKVRPHGIKVAAAFSREGSAALGPVWPCLGRNPSHLVRRPLITRPELPRCLKTACYFARKQGKNETELTLIIQTREFQKTRVLSN